MKNGKMNFISGVLVGTLMVSGAMATDLLVSRTTHNIIVNGEKAEVEAYNVNGHNFFKLKDLGERLDFSVIWDEGTQSVLIDSSKPYEEQGKTEEKIEEKVEEKVDEIVRIPQSDAPFRPLVGQKVEAEVYKDGKPTGEKTTFIVEKEKPEEQPLPEPICDWSKFPELELPEATVIDYGKGQVGVMNLYETRRMQYTLYNLISTNEMTWKNGEPAKGKNGNYKATVSFEIDKTQPTQVMWPYRESELKKVFDGCPINKWKVIAYDEYVEGRYTHTEYYLQN